MFAGFTWLIIVVTTSSSIWYSSTINWLRGQGHEENATQREKKHELKIHELETKIIKSTNINSSFFASFQALHRHISKLSRKVEQLKSELVTSHSRL